MKKNLFIKTDIFIIAAAVFLGCSQPNSPATNPSATSEPSKTANDITLFPNANPYLASYEESSKTLTLNKKFGNAAFHFKDWKTVDASDYSYAEFSYSDLNIPQVSLRLFYNDESYSQVFLQTHLDKVYIKLDDSKKKALKYISLNCNAAENYYTDKFTVKINSLKLVKEKPAATKAPIVDKKDGTFNTNISAMELSDKIAVGWNASRMATCPYYNTENTKYLTFGLQEEYTPEKNAEDKVIKHNPQTLGTSAQGLTLEYNLLPAESKEHLKAGFDYGFKSLRVNVTFFAHIIDNKYTIDPYWMERVKEVVDWAIADGYYVVLNDHHSVYKYMNSPLSYGTGYNVNEADKEESKRFLKAIWTQIATAFNGSYDEHLIFETMNEPRKCCPESEYSTGEYWPFAAMQNPELKRTLPGIINEYNQIIVDAIRATGGNNANRFIMCPTYATDRETLFNFDFKLPTDSASDKLMVAIHWYPYLSSGATQYNETLRNEFITYFSKVYENYTSKGTPVCLTEFYIENDNFGDPNFNKYTKADRLTCLKDFCELAGKYGLSMMAWDDGMVHTIVNRKAPYALFDGDDFLPALISAWEKGRKAGADSVEKRLDKIFAENISNEIKLSTSEKNLTAWGDANAVSIVSGEKLTGLKEGSILKISLKGDASKYRNFAFHKKNGWDKISMTSNFYSESCSYNSSDNNFFITSEKECSPLYIKLNAENALVLKEGFNLRGMNTIVNEISVEF